MNQNTVYSTRDRTRAVTHPGQTPHSKSPTSAMIASGADIDQELRLIDNNIEFFCIS